MVDSGTLTLLATVVQTVVITLTLIVFIFQFRSQEKAIREASYQNLLGRYNDFMMSGVEADSQLLDRMLSQTGKRPEEKDLPLLRRLVISYGIIEEAYELYSKGWIDSESWEQWNTWLKALTRNPYFEAFHRFTLGMYDKDFQAHVTSLLGPENP